MPLKYFDEKDPRVKARINALRNAAVKQAKERWKSYTFGALNTRDSQYGWGDLRLTHFRLTNVTYKGGWYNLAITSLGNDLTWINNKTTNDRAYILIYGIGNNSPSPQITQIKFKFGAEDGDWMDLSQLYGSQVAWCYFEHGFVINPQTAITIYYSSLTCQAVNTEYLYLIGEVLAMKSVLTDYDNSDTV